MLLIVLGVMEEEDKENGCSLEMEGDKEQISKLINIVVQWFLVLEQVKIPQQPEKEISDKFQVSADRADEPYWQTSNAKCQCSKAEEIVGKCRELKPELEAIVQVS